MKKRNSEENKQKKKETLAKSNKKKRTSDSFTKRKKKSKGSIQKKKIQRRKQILRDTILTAVITLLMTVVIGSFFFKVITVQGFGMIPTLRNGDILLVQKNNEFQRFDLAVFVNEKNKTQVRRIIGLPGEKIAYKEDILYVNDQPIDEKFIVDEVNESQRNGKNFTEDFTSEDLTSTKIIPDGYYLVLGDNRSYATDSRVYGLISLENMIGKIYS
ncbi:signal peptidase I [Enterococcus termitis]|uniref:signal peptidase I n=1 Tax=Enterococcus termitis TaxID=332950 RepID=UPI0009F4BB59|nr:signal peptidase I [Enterococcus termitis]